MTAVLVAVAAGRQSGASAVHSVLLVALAVILPVAALMVRQVSRGQWENADASNATERPILFLVSMAGLAAALVWLLRYDPASFLIRGLVVVGAFMLTAAVLTRWIKLSLHVAFVTLAATALWQIESPVGVVLFAAAPVVAWARLVLSRHSPWEVLAGGALGFITGLALVWL